MGDILDKTLIEKQNKCPIHNVPYSGVCVNDDCYETGIICPKCTPESCVEKLGHKKISTDEFFKKYIKNLFGIIDFKSLNELISVGLEVQKKQLDLQSQAFEEWEIKMINDKFEKFKEKMTQKIIAFANKLVEKLQKIYDEFAESKEVIENSIIEVPDFKLEKTIKFLNENKDNKVELEKYLQTIQKFMDNENLFKSQKDLKNVIYGKYLFDHLKDFEKNLNEINNLKNDLKEYITTLIKCIFPENEIIKVYSSQNLSNFETSPQDLKYKETITTKCLKSYTIDSIFDAYYAFDGKCYLASSILSN